MFLQAGTKVISNSKYHCVGKQHAGSLKSPTTDNLTLDGWKQETHSLEPCF